MDERAVRGIPWTLLAYAATRVVSVLTTLVLARLLVPADFGLFALATLAVTVISVLPGIWLGAALVVDPDMDERGVGTVLTLLVAASLLSAAGLVLLAPLVAALFHEPRLADLVAVTAAVLVFSGTNWFFQTMLQRELRFKRVFVTQLVQTVAFSAVALALAVSGAGVWSLAVGYVAGFAASMVVSMALSPSRVRPAFDRKTARHVITSGRGFLAQDLSTFVMENLDYVAVGRALGPSQLGFYSMAYRQAELPNYAIADSVAKVTFPAFAQMRHRGDDVAPAFLTTMRLVALAACPIGIVLSAAAAPFTVALLGDEWRPMIAPLTILGVWAIVRPLQVTSGRLLNSLGRAGVYGGVSMMSLLPLGIATFVAAHIGGVRAVAWVLLVHVCVTFAAMAIAVSRLAGVPLRDQVRELRPLAIASLAAWPATRVIADLTGAWPPALALVASTAACVTVYLATVRAAAPGLLSTAADQVRRAMGRAPRAGATTAIEGKAARAARLAGSVARSVRRTVDRIRAPRPGDTAGVSAALGYAATTVLPARQRAAVVGLGASVLLGTLSAIRPTLAVALLGAAMITMLAFGAPVAHLLLLLAITAIVPFDVQNAFSLGGGARGAPGLFVSDALLITGLARASLVLLSRPPDRGARPIVALMGAFLAVCVLQFIHGVKAGYAPSDAGAEFRALLGVGVALVALPILRDPAARRRLLNGLVVIGLLVGLWGLAQWTLDIPFSATGDAGVRPGVRFTTAGRGQIQGGLFAFPLAALIAFAALLAPVARSGGARLALLAVIALNSVALLLTYERTFWFATVVGFCIVGLSAQRGRRARAMVGAGLIVTLVIAVFAVSSPADLTAAEQRLSSVGQYGTDRSVRYRIVESRHVVEQIRERPVVGSGLGASILWDGPTTASNRRSRRSRTTGTCGSSGSSAFPARCCSS